MDLEQIKSPKNHKKLARYIIWAIFIISIFFVISILYKEKQDIVQKNISTVIKFKENANKASYQKIISNIKKNGIKFINEYPPGKVLGSNNFSNKNNFAEVYGNSLSMFRGNPTRTWYGNGDIPINPKIVWKYPEEAMCAKSTAKGETKEWCGTGWTGQPVVYKEKNKTEIIFGAYDKKVHFVNPTTGEETRKPFETGDIIKGTVTVDPDGFPLIYFGSRDNKLRIVSLQEDEPKEIWYLDAKKIPGIWNDDWDGNPIIINDYLITGGENGWFYVIKLNRKYTEENKVSVNPEITFSMPSYDENFIKKVGDNNVSIENSVAIYKNTAYFGNSGGRVMGIDISNIENKKADVVFDFWTGDDIDSSIVIDSEGNLYVSIEEERLNERSQQIGQIIKLNPNKENPLEWSIKIPSRSENINGGIWSTPAILNDYLYVTTNPGDFLVIDKNTGDITFKEEIGAHGWSSPLISNNKILIATCFGKLLIYDLTSPDMPVKVSDFQMPGGSCIESTPALIDGELYFGSRDGFFYKIKEKE